MAMRVLLMAGCVALPAVAAEAAVAPATADAGGEPACAALSCPDDDDRDAWLGARLLVARFGADAPAYAERVAERYARQNDAQSAAFWHHVAALAARLAADP